MATSVVASVSIYGLLCDSDKDTSSSRKDLDWIKGKKKRQIFQRKLSMTGTPLVSKASPSDFNQKRPSFVFSILAFAMEVAEEASIPHEDASKSFGFSMFQGSSPRHIPLPPKNRADNVNIHNPLLRAERMGCGWVSAILEWDGVIVEDDADIDTKAWIALAEEEGKRLPPSFLLKRAEGMKNEQAISELFCWSRDPRETKRLAIKKEELYEKIQGGICRVKPGSFEFLLTLRKNKIPVAIVSTSPRIRLEKAIELVGMTGFFNVIIAAEDVYRGKPDPEMFLYASERLGFIPERCIVFGNSNPSVEAAHDAFMKCVAIVGKRRAFELSAADLVVRKLDDLSVVDLKNLADLDSPEFQIPEPEPEPEPEESSPRSQVAVQDFW